MSQHDDEAQTGLPKRLEIPGEIVGHSKLAGRRPAVDRLRAVRTGEATATLYVDWPESPDTGFLALKILKRARVFAQATGRKDRSLEMVPLEVEVLVQAPGPELEEPSATMLMDLSDLPMAQIEMHFSGMDPTKDSLDWFIDVVVAGAWGILESSL